MTRKRIGSPQMRAKNHKLNHNQTNLCFLIFLLLLFESTSMEAQPEIKQEWTTFEQIRDVSFLTKKVKFKLTALARVVSDDTTAWAGLWVRVDNKEGGLGFFNATYKRPIKIKEWRTYTVEGEMNETSDKVHFGGRCSGNGKFYFDDFVLMVENDKGIMEIAFIQNPGFEVPVRGYEIPHWVQGISSDRVRPIKVKGFSFSSSNESGEGKYSLIAEGKGIAKDSTYYFGPREGFSPQMGALVAMLNNLSARVESQVVALSQKELDYLMDDKANSIGALIMHLAAAEAFYQVYTFENRGFNDDEKKKWQAAFDLGDKAREEFVGHDVEYYLAIYRQVREKTIHELQKRNDAWLLQTPPGRQSNYFSWFHVMEHQSSHLGQILLMKKRLPETDELPKEKLNLDH